MVRVVEPEGIGPLFEHAIRSIQGGRNYQEDAAAVWPGGAPFGPRPVALPAEAGSLIAILSDGMGGHAAGALASQTICTAFIDSYVAGEGRAVGRLAAALKAGNKEITRLVEEDGSRYGMGATAVGVAFGAWGAHWISVGDSPMYLFRRGELVQINEDHSLGGMLDKLAEAGEITPEKAASDPRRHMLRSAVSGEDIELIDASKNPLPLERGDVVVIASDGIQTLIKEEIRHVIEINDAKGAVVIADSLIGRVEAAAEPHQDNTTAIVVRVTG